MGMVSPSPPEEKEKFSGQKRASEREKSQFVERKREKTNFPLSEKMAFLFHFVRVCLEEKAEHRREEEPPLYSYGLLLLSGGLPKICSGFKWSPFSHAQKEEGREENGPYSLKRRAAATLNLIPTS